MKQRFFFLISLSIFFFDQLIKNYFNIHKPVSGIFRFTNNTGAAFGIFKGGNLVFAVFTFIIISIIIYLYLSKPIYFKERNVCVSAALIVGGALGNLVDRVTYGYVIDYINLGFWPVFNLADIALTVGALILIYAWWNNN